jgi:hypothetical protein
MTAASRPHLAAHPQVSYSDLAVCCSYKPTYGVDYFSKAIQLPGNIHVTLQVRSCVAYHALLHAQQRQANIQEAAASTTDITVMPHAPGHQSRHGHVQPTGTHHTALAATTPYNRCTRCSHTMHSTSCDAEQALNTGPRPATAAAMGHRRRQLRVWHAAHLPVWLPGRAADVRRVKQGGETRARHCTPPSSKVHPHTTQERSSRHKPMHETTVQDAG